MENFAILREIAKGHKLIARNIILSHKTCDRIGKFLILVEGVDDIDIYKHFFKEDKVDLHDCHGCEVVDSVHKIIGSETGWSFLSILDSDFKRLEGLPVHPDNMFYTDSHDSEMLMVQFPKFVRDVMNKPLGCRTAEDLTARIEYELQNVSMTKWFNMSFHYSYTFVGLDLANLSPKSQISLATVIQTMVPTQNSPKVFPGKKLFKFLKDNPKPPLDQITTGHDLITRWASIVRHEYHKQYSDVDFRKIVCDAFTIKYVKKTTLYKGLEQWCNKNRYFIMMP